MVNMNSQYISIYLSIYLFFMIKEDILISIYLSIYLFFMIKEDILISIYLSIIYDKKRHIDIYLSILYDKRRHIDIYLSIYLSISARSYQSILYTFKWILILGQNLTCLLKNSIISAISKIVPMADHCCLKFIKIWILVNNFALNLSPWNSVISFSLILFPLEFNDDFSPSTNEQQLKVFKLGEWEQSTFVSYSVLSNLKLREQTVRVGLVWSAFLV